MNTFDMIEKINKIFGKWHFSGEPEQQAINRELLKLLAEYRKSLAVKTAEQISIYDLLPLLCKGYVAMDENETWHWYEYEPALDSLFWDPGDEIDLIPTCCLSDAFNIAPFDGDWKDSLMECGK